MNIGGWICMTVAVSTISSLFFWCCWKMFSGKPEQSRGDSSNDVDANEDYMDENSDRRQ